MIIPFGDENIKGGYKPIVSYSLIVINVAMFIFQMSLGLDQFIEFTNTFGVVPHNLMKGENLPALISHMFMHGGLLHLLGNLLFLWIFADNIEAIIGNIPFLIFYLFGGFFALGSHIVTDLDSLLPMVGASGAISAVMGAYLVMFPKSKIKVLILVFKKHIPAFIFLGLWFVTQLISGVGTIAPENSEEAGGIAWWAHIGGFVYGIIIGWYLRTKIPSNETFLA